MNVTVSELLVRYMERLGIEVIFGMPGAHVLPIYDGLYRSSIDSVLVKHEQGASFMAGGYARLSHHVSACIATAGPGATNLLTGVANAYAEQLPVLVLTGETSTYIFGRGGLQESSGEGGAIDQAELFRGITRYRKLIERTDYLGQVLNQATQALYAHQPGPVLLSVPYNVQKETVDDSVLEQIHFPVTPSVSPEAGGPLDEFARRVIAAKRPVIIAGYGCIKAGARGSVSRLSSTFGIPVTTSLKGKGVVAEGEGLSLGCLGVTSDGAARRYIENHSDLLIFLGAGFNERTSYVWNDALLSGRGLIQVDRDPAQLGKVFKPDLAIQGDIDQVVLDLHERLQDSGMASKCREGFEQHQVVSDDDADDPAAQALENNRARFQLIEHFYQGLSRQFPEHAIVFDDNIVFAQSFYQVSDSNHYFPNTGVSSLGHAIPAAIGARFFDHEAPIFAILGDGGFQMCCMEIMTAVNYGTPVNIVVINNATMGLIRKNQFQLYDERYIDCDFVNPDFAYLAQSFGIAHYRIEQPQEVDALFAQADLEGRINLIEIILDKNAFPTYLSSR